LLCQQFLYKLSCFQATQKLIGNSLEADSDLSEHVLRAFIKIHLTVIYGVKTPLLANLVANILLCTPGKGITITSMFICPVSDLNVELISIFHAVK